VLQFAAVKPAWRWTALALLVSSTLAGALAGDRLLALGDHSRESLRWFSEVVEEAHDAYGTDVPYRDLVYAGIQGMLRTLDPHTTFLSAEAHAEMQERHQASFYGLGILVGQRNGRLTVITPIEGTPAARLGIRAGDIIHLIEGQPTSEMSIDEAVSKLKGPKGTEVGITILRAGLPEPLELSVVRAEIPQATVRYAYLIAPGTGYISVSDFSRSTGGEVARAIEDLRALGMERLLLDLRNNGGGLLDQAIDVSAQFVPSGSSVVATRGRVHDATQSFSADDRRDPLGLPLVVLVNAGTASAAEIVSGAVQDHDVGLVLGTPTWGKGLVQTVYNLSYGAGLALTTAKYYTPSGRLIQRDYESYLDYYARTDVDEPGHRLGDEEPRSEEYDTDLGRKVYGGGGIRPDVEVEPHELSPPLQYLLARAAFFRFAVEWANRHGDDAIGPDWKPDKAFEDAFYDWMVGEGLETAEEATATRGDATSSAFVRRQLRAEVLGAKYGIEASHKVLAEGDAQIQAALSLFPQAATLLAQRQGLDRLHDVRTAETVRH